MHIFMYMTEIPEARHKNSKKSIPMLKMHHVVISVSAAKNSGESRVVFLGIPIKTYSSYMIKLVLTYK